MAELGNSDVSTECKQAIKRFVIKAMGFVDKQDK